MDRLWAPWRLSYVTAAPVPPTDCIFCDASAGPRRRSGAASRPPLLRHPQSLSVQQRPSDGGAQPAPLRARAADAGRAGGADAADAPVGDGAERGVSSAGHQRRHQSRQGGRRRHREPPAYSSRAALVGRHELHDGRGRDARAARRSALRRPRACGRSSSGFTPGRVRRVRVGASGCSRCDVRWVRAFVLLVGAATVITAQDAPKRRNAIIFVADGLRHGSVNPIDTPALYRVRTEGVYFANSHAVFPTQTMPNAAAIATGHYPGDTGQFAQQIFIGYPLFATGILGQPPGTMVPDVEDPFVLADLNHHFGGNYLREASLLAFARSYGYNTAALGKTGPAASQDLSEAAARPREDCANRSRSFSTARRARRAPCRSAPARVGAAESGRAAARRRRRAINRRERTPSRARAPRTSSTSNGSPTPTTKAILPAFAKSPSRSCWCYWSGDPDLHAARAGGQPEPLSPGINGPTSKAADSERRPKPEADTRLPRRESRRARQHERLRHVGPRVFNGEPARRRCIGARDAQLFGDACATRTAGAAGSERRISSAGISGDRPRARAEPAAVRPGAADRRRARRQALRESRSNASRSRPQTCASGPPAAPALIGGAGRVSLPIDAKVVIAQTSIYVPGNDRGLVRADRAVSADAGLYRRHVRQRSIRSACQARCA